MIEELMANRIQRAHDLGFRVFLCAYHERLGAHHEYGVGLKIDVEDFLEQAEEIAIRWAEISEENGVEMYAPRKELQKFVGQKKALEWDDEILPALRSVYSGDLVRGALVDFAKWDPLAKQVWQGEELPTSFEGWDYLGVDFYGSDTDTFEDLAAMYALFVDKVSGLKAQHNLKGVVFEELAEPHHGTEGYWNDDLLSGNDVLEHMYQIYFEGGAGSIDGFFPWIWEDEYRDLPSGKRERVSPDNIIRQYYTSLVIPSYSGPIANVSPSFNITYSATRVLLQDDFDDDSKWRLYGENVSVSNGVLEWIGQEGVGLRDASSEDWEDYIFSGDFMVIDGEGLDIYVRSTDSGNYPFLVRPIAHIQLVGPDSQGGFMATRETHFLIDYNKWHTFTIVVKDNALQFFIGNNKVLEYLDPDPLPRGSVGIRSQGRALVDNVLIQEIQ